MRIRGTYGTLVLLLSLCGPVSTAWSSTTTPVPGGIKGSAGQEAVVMKIDGDTITLKSLGDENKVFTVSRKDAGPLQAGDRVLVDGNSVKKLGTMTDPVSKPGSADESATKSKNMEQMPTTPEKPSE